MDFNPVLIRISLNGIDTAHLLLSPTLTLPLKIGNNLQVRLEGDIELIDDDGKITTRFLFFTVRL